MHKSSLSLDMATTCQYYQQISQIMTTGLLFKYRHTVEKKNPKNVNPNYVSSSCLKLFYYYTAAFFGAHRKKHNTVNS